VVATIRNRFKYLLPLLSCTLVACTHQPYPDAWPRPLAKLEPDGCTALTGSYRDGPAGLFDMLTKYGGYQRDFDYVRVGMPEKGVLLFEAYKSGKIMGDLRVSEGDGTLMCKEDGAELPMSGVYGQQEVLVASKKRILLTKDETGGLLLQNDEAGVAFYGVIPIPGSAVEWFRFSPYAPAGNGSQP